MAVWPLIFIAGFVPLLAIHCRHAGVSGWWVPPMLAFIELALVDANLDLLPATASAELVGIPRRGMSAVDERLP